MFEEVILVGNKCDFEERSWEVDSHTGEEVTVFYFCCTTWVNHSYPF